MNNYQLFRQCADIDALIARLISKANDDLNDSDKRFGGYLTALETRTGKPALIMAHGMIPEEKQEKYFSLSQEKPLRLFQHKEHNTSWDSRDIGQSKFGGAIRGVEYLWSFSGHQELVDEALDIALFYSMEPFHEIFSGNCKDLFAYYWNEVSKRNKFVRPLVCDVRNKRLNTCFEYLIQS